MNKDLIISSNHHETKVAIVEDEQLVEVYFQRANEYSLVGSIHKGRVTRVLPGMQSAFVNIGLERDAFLYVSDFFEDSDEYEPIGSVQDQKQSKQRSSAGRSANTASQVTQKASSNAVQKNESEAKEKKGRRPRRRRGRDRGFPDSKYAASEVETVTQSASKSNATSEKKPEDSPNDFFLLPGESLAKYEQVEPETVSITPAADRESVAPKESIDKAATETADRTDQQEIEVRSDFEDEKNPSDFSAEDVEQQATEPDSGAGEDELEANSKEEHDPESEADDEVIDAPEQAIANESEASTESAPKSEDVEFKTEDSDIQEMILGQFNDVLKEEIPSGVVTAENDGKDADSKPLVSEDSEATNDAKASVREPESRQMHRVSRRGRRRSRSNQKESRERRPERKQQPNEIQQSNEHTATRPERPPLPSISDLLKEGQEILVQVAKEPLGQKGARITSHIALPGRYVVYMPTLDHLGVSRKIASDEERQRLRRILQANHDGIPGGFIVRTAGEGKTEQEIAADMRFLSNSWMDIRQKADKKPAPLLLHHDLQIVERILRDQVTDQFKSIWVDNEEAYEDVLGFVQRFQPSLVNRVKLYTRTAPIFDTLDVTSELEKALRPRVWLKSGGYIVINQTEALVAIDINTGKFVGKSNRLEDTIVKTNIEAIKEVVRQMRLRDLGGIIVVDFIDMDERKNRQKVMQALEEAMGADRAPSKILQFNDFGLVAITRKRVKQSLERTLCSPCPYCEGAGYVKSVDTIIGEIIQEAQKLSGATDNQDMMLRVHPDVAKELKSSKNDYLQELEETLGCAVMIKGDPLLHHEKFDLS